MGQTNQSGSRWLTQLTLDRGTDETAYQETGLYDGQLAEQIVLREGDREFFIEWTTSTGHKDQVVPEISMHCLDWSVFMDWKGLFDSLGAIDKASVSPEQVLAIALQHGFENMSEQTKEHAESSNRSKNASMRP